MHGEPLRILLVEDNPDHVKIVQRSFKDHQVANAIHHTEDGEEALEYLFQRGRYADPASCPRPNLILLDLRLPKVDGLDVLMQIKSDTSLRKIPVVILSTSEAERDLVRAYERHVNSYLVKPVDFATFTRMLKDLGYYWLAWNTAPVTNPDDEGHDG